MSPRAANQITSDPAEFVNNTSSVKLEEPQSLSKLICFTISSLRGTIGCRAMVRHRSTLYNSIWPSTSMRPAFGELLNQLTVLSVTAISSHTFGDQTCALNVRTLEADATESDRKIINSETT